MEENKRTLPSLPSNYVTLVQLQERWMKEQQQQESEDDEQQEKLGVALASTEKKIELEAEGEDLKKNASKKKRWYQKKGKGRKARAEDKGAIGGGGESHAPQASVAMEDVVVADPTVEMEGKFQDMSIDGGNGKSWRPRSNKGRSLHRGKYTNHLRDREGGKPKNARGMMVWVKKGDSVGGAQSSS